MNWRLWAFTCCWHSSYLLGWFTESHWIWSTWCSSAEPLPPIC